MKFLLDHIYILSAILLGVASQLLIKWKMSEYSLDNHETFYQKFLFGLSMLTNPYIIFSLLLTFIAGILWMIAMTKFDLSYAYPFTALSFVLILVFTALFFHEPISTQKIIGSACVIMGIVIASKGI